MPISLVVDLLNSRQKQALRRAVPIVRVLLDALEKELGEAPTEVIRIVEA